MWKLSSTHSCFAEESTTDLHCNGLFCDTKSDADAWWNTWMGARNVHHTVSVMYNPQGDVVKVSFA